jgi:5-methylcytosine-specific restriction protein A
MPWRPQTFGKVTARTASGHQLARMAAAVLDRDGHQCQVCGVICPHPKHHEADHVVALSHGGPDTITNMVTLCRDCHREKTKRDSRGRGR